MNTTPPTLPISDPLHTFGEPTTVADLTASAPARLDWIWRGYIARGNVTLLTSQWKSGKTTLLSVLLSQLPAESVLAGQAVTPAKACVVSEEGPQQWGQRCERLGLTTQATFHFRPFAGKPSMAQWHDFLRHLLAVRRKRGVDFFVFDTLSSFLPGGSENQIDAALAALRPLEQLTGAGAALLLLHHPRKGQTLPGQAARGSGAFGSYCDIMLEMQCAAANQPQDRRRILRGWSRYEETPSELMLALDADGRNYTVCEAAAEPDEKTSYGITIACDVLEHSPLQLTRDGIRDEWPERPKPHSGSLWRWLDQAVELGRIVRAGTGRRGDPFRYHLPGKEVPWIPDSTSLLDKLKAMEEQHKQ